jgi:hypothetical protein
MPFNNLNNRHLTGEEQAPITDAINNLRALTLPIAASLTAEERKRYGSINELNKGIVNKAKSFNDSQPALSSPDVDWVEYGKDYDMRVFIENNLQTIYSIVRDLESSKILFDFDNYTAANADYAYTGYKLKSGDTGYQAKYDEMQQFYYRPGGSGSETET